MSTPLEQLKVGQIVSLDFGHCSANARVVSKTAHDVQIEFMARVTYNGDADSCRFNVVLVEED